MAHKCFINRDDFPVLGRSISGYPVAYLDNAATTLKPRIVLDAITRFYSTCGANISRGMYTLAEEATAQYEDAREVIAGFIGALPEEVIFTHGATDGINMIASTWSFDALLPGDNIIVTAMEHHSNLLPWQRCALRKGATLSIVPLRPEGTLDMRAFEDMLSSRTKIVAVCHVSNVLGTVNDIETIVRMAHQVGAKVLVDAAQSVGHQRINVHEMGSDFLVFSGHKVLGPTGVGILYVKKDLFDQMMPYQVGGGMVNKVSSVRGVEWAAMPQRLESGTPAVSSVIGLASAVRYMQGHIDFEALRMYEARLCARFIEGLIDTKRAVVYGPVDQLKESGHIVSFNIHGWHPHDVALYCDTYGVCVRAGMQCAQPLAEHLGIGPSVRMSTFAYTTESEIDRLLDVLST
jgi:cysteine desulfurase/selenocysteine lyase